ncbi:metallophosphoesterase family protein [Thermoflavimicrobium dichotomicum]|uniref:DNA repair exonuclease SbcCD nuclease subunit n=1 Tax=Thermoflavimicrobium dichotomicum TaxID=46223 RepID=A0A1I3MUV2_9BACL|nr:DNA repair exonuclease [Thermoflavimicrobium dichotomicum]SFJ00505.1 DNA repair exonuclease SbcCD nuclease subunit [Thermoflavimicrobium dichotomicum]
MQPVTWIHTADLHLDMPVQGWKGSKEQMWKRQQDYRTTFQKIISLVKEKQASFLFIAGDFLEHGYVTHSTLEFVLNQLERIPSTQVWITPGNHDPYRTDSYYHLIRWPDHVHIFKGDWEEHVWSESDLVIYGKGFYDFAEPNPHLPAIKRESVRNLMIVHGTFTTGREESPYFPIYKEEIAKLPLDYIALGHIHKASTDTIDNERKTLIRYAGSPESLSWKELGVRTVTWGKLDDQGIQIEEIPVQTSRYELISVDISECRSKEDVHQLLLAYLAGLDPSSSYLTCLLTGQMSEEIRREKDLYLWLSHHIKQNGFIEVYFEDETKPELDLSYYRKQMGIIGTFIRRMEVQIEQADPDFQPFLRRAMFETVELLLRKKVER